MNVSFTVNGVRHDVSVAPGEVLLDVLRRLGRRGVKTGCRSGSCGACTVLLNGVPVPSCLVLAGRVDGQDVTTIEGLGTPDEPHPLQREFLKRGAAQCAYCMQGMILSAKALLDEDPDPDRDDIRRGLSGNLCRCTGYVKAVEAVEAVALEAQGVAPTRDDDGASEYGERYASVGRRTEKTEGPGLLCGRARYTDDFTAEGMLYGRVKRSPHAHARIVSIDASRALELPGVHCVLTHEDVPRVPYTSAGQNYPEPSPYDMFMLDSKVRFVGDRVAAVAADTPLLARKACDLIEVEYEVLPAILDPRESMKDGSPVIHDEDDATGIEDASRNLAARIDLAVGDPDRVFESAPHVFEQEYDVQYVHTTPTETHVTLTYLDEKNRLVVVTSTQVPFHARRIVSRVNELPVSQVRVVKPRIGGGFGGKQGVVIEDICAALTLRTRRPVKIMLDRDEELSATRTRHPQRMRVRTAVDESGGIVARELSTLVNTGAYGPHALTVPSNTGSKTLPLYRTGNLRFTAESVYTNLPVAGAFRGYGATQGYFAMECQMDEMAHALGLDPVEFRLSNLIRAGDSDPIATSLGEGKAGFERVIRTNGLPECWQRARTASGWDAWRKELLGELARERLGTPGSTPYSRRGMGVAFAMHGSGIPGDDMGAATIKANEDGSFHLLIGATDLGTGSDTILAQMAAEVLGVPPSQIIVYSSDTDRTPFDVGAYASSTTYVSGGAVVKAAEMVRERLLYHASKMLEAPVDELTCADGVVSTRDGRSSSMADVTRRAMYGEDKEQVSFTASNVTYACPPPFAAAVADLEVDTRTGRIDVRDFTCAVDLGFAINPALAEGQIEGGIATGLGYALTEEMLFNDEGRMVNANLLDYMIFTAPETPHIKAILVETDEPTGPFGAKSVSEIPLDVVAPAVGNAVFAATGLRLRSLPFTPERVLAGLEALADAGR
ncbi:MAG: molybdopterin-dependent oxidoreductase [Candidatus Eisenbacteria bacterium]|nr:molybdopterin-dependent oxidoreductase [Candidatus Eisenbacteria bacterium]